MCVLCVIEQETILPWNIVSTSEVEHTFRDFFDQCIRSRIARTYLYTSIWYHLICLKQVWALDKVYAGYGGFELCYRAKHLVGSYCLPEKGSPAGACVQWRRNAFGVLM